MLGPLAGQDVVVIHVQRHPRPFAKVGLQDAPELSIDRVLIGVSIDETMQQDTPPNVHRRLLPLPTLEQVPAKFPIRTPGSSLLSKRCRDNSREEDTLSSARVECTQPALLVVNLPLTPFHTRNGRCTLAVVSRKRINIIILLAILTLGAVVVTRLLVRYNIRTAIQHLVVSAMTTVVDRILEMNNDSAVVEPVQMQSNNFFIANINDTPTPICWKRYCARSLGAPMYGDRLSTASTIASPIQLFTAAKLRLMRTIRWYAAKPLASSSGSTKTGITGVTTLQKRR